VVGQLDSGAVDRGHQLFHVRQSFEGSAAFINKLVSAVEELTFNVIKLLYSSFVPHEFLANLSSLV